MKYIHQHPCVRLKSHGAPKTQLMSNGGTRARHGDRPEAQALAPCPHETPGHLLGAGAAAEPARLGSPTMKGSHENKPKPLPETQGSGHKHQAGRAAAAGRIVLAS